MCEERCDYRSQGIKSAQLSASVLGKAEARTAEAFLAFGVYLQPLPMNFGEKAGQIDSLGHQLSHTEHLKKNPWGKKNAKILAPPPKEKSKKKKENQREIC